MYISIHPQRSKRRYFIYETQCSSQCSSKEINSKNGLSGIKNIMVKIKNSVKGLEDKAEETPRK